MMVAMIPKTMVLMLPSPEDVRVSVELDTEVAEGTVVLFGVVV